MMTLSARLAVTKGRSSGFDYMRIGLALLVVVFHSFSCYPAEVYEGVVSGPLRPLWAMILPMFFGLSGFLVAGSLERSATIVNFLGLRVIRLLPALAAESVLSLLIIGTLFTTLAPSQFFQQRETYLYLLNIVGDVHYFLPGVFESNPFSSKVNGQLWTLPVELKCYAVIAVLAVLGAYRSKSWLLVACVALQAYCSYRMFFVFRSPGDLNGLLGASALVLSFIYGVTLYRFRDHIPWSGSLAVSGLVFAVVLLRLNGWNSFAVLPVVYLTAYLGLTSPRRNRLVSSGDYSYGVYLYSGPIQQAVVAAFPLHRTWWENLLISTPLVLIMAAGSWHLIEKRALKLRPILAEAERHWIPIRDRCAALRSRIVPPGLRARWARDQSAA